MLLTDLSSAFSSLVILQQAKEMTKDMWVICKDMWVIFARTVRLLVSLRHCWTWLFSAGLQLLRSMILTVFLVS